jgi:thiaminase
VVVALARNWTSDEFARFVQDLEGLVDAYGVQPGSVHWKSAENVWNRVFELEDAFWPEEGEEVIMCRC